MITTEHDPTALIAIQQKKRTVVSLAFPSPCPGESSGETDCNIPPFYARLRGLVPRAHPSGNHDLETQAKKSHRVGAIQGTAACRPSSGNGCFSIRKKVIIRLFLRALREYINMPSNRPYYSWKDSRLPPSLRLSPKSLPPCATSPAGERRRQAGVNAGTGGKKYIIKAARRARPQRTRHGLNPSRTRLPGGERGRGREAGALGASRPRGGARRTRPPVCLGRCRSGPRRGGGAAAPDTRQRVRSLAQRPRLLGRGGARGRPAGVPVATRREEEAAAGAKWRR